MAFQESYLFSLFLYHGLFEGKYCAGFLKKTVWFQSYFGEYLGHSMLLTGILFLIFSYLKLTIHFNSVQNQKLQGDLLSFHSDVILPDQKLL